LVFNNGRSWPGCHYWHYYGCKKRFGFQHASYSYYHYGFVLRADHYAAKEKPEEE
jgi:hypothetical protein